MMGDAPRAQGSQGWAGHKGTFAVAPSVTAFACGLSLALNAFFASMVLSFFRSVCPSVLPLLLLRLWDRPVSGGLGASVHVSDTHYGGKKKKKEHTLPPPLLSPNNSNINIVSDHPSSAASSQGAMVGRPGPCRFRRFQPCQPSPAQPGQHLLLHLLDLHVHPDPEACPRCCCTGLCCRAAVPFWLMGAPCPA